MTTQATAASAQARVAWVDGARGIGIVLVVYGHALRGQIAAGLYPPSLASLWQDHLIYTFHMPLFFFLSGLFASLGPSRRRFVGKRLRTLAYPYLLWSIVQGGLTIVAGRYANHPTAVADLLRIGWQPIGQFWFLYALFLCNLLLLLPRWLFFALVPVLFAFSRLSIPSSILTATAADLPFFVAGVLMGARQVSGWLVDGWRAALLTVAGWGIFAGLALIPNPFSSWPVIFAMAVTGIGGTVGVAALVAPYASWLVRLGAATMPIFLLHVIAQGMVRAAVAHFALPPTAMLLLVALVALLAPVLAWIALSHFGCAERLGLGKPAKERPAGISAEVAQATA